MPEPLATQVLIERVQQGDQGALNELVERYQMRVLAVVRIRLGVQLRKKLESWDVVQEVLIDALRKVQSFDFRTEGAFLKYLNRVVENRIRDEAEHWAAQKRDVGRETPLEKGRSSGSVNPLSVLGDSGQSTPSKIVSRKEEMAQLEDAMDLLAEESAEYRDLIVAAKLEGRSYQEIADEMGISPDAVRMRLKRAELALTKIFKSMQGTE
jgi:RNA polymerase sigma-70 factor, ECF subfamily